MALNGGKFKLIRNENFVEHLIALGIPEEKAISVNDLRPVMEISIDGKRVTFTSITGTLNHSSTLVLDEETDEKIALDINVKSITTTENNKIKIYSKGPNGETGIRTFEFFEREMIMTLASGTNSIPVAKRYYEKL